MKTPQERLDATCRLSDAERRRLIAAINEADGADGERSKDDTQRGYAIRDPLEPVAAVVEHQNQPLFVSSGTWRVGRSCLRTLRQKDVVARSNLRPARVGWIAFLTSLVRVFMPWRRRTDENSAGIIVDPPILDLLGITPETELDLTTDGISLVITPQFVPDTGGHWTADVQARTLKTDAGTFRKLAW